MSICGSGKFGVRAYGPSFLVRSWKFLHIHESTPASKGNHCKLSRIEYSPQNKRGMEMFLHPRQRSEDILISSDRQKFLYSMALCLNVENNILGCCELSTHSRHSSALWWLRESVTGPILAMVQLSIFALCNGVQITEVPG